LIGKVAGIPDIAHVSTSYVERQNLTMRMSMRRFTGLTNAFSKKLANHEASVALYFMHYNFCRQHKTLRVTPAMHAGISNYIWSMEDVLMMLETMDRQHRLAFFTSNGHNRSLYPPRLGRGLRGLFGGPCFFWGRNCER